MRSSFIKSCHLPFFASSKRQSLSASFVPGGAARRSPNRATGGVAGHETTSFPGGESPSRGGGGPSHYYPNNPSRINTIAFCCLSLQKVQSSFAGPRENPFAPREGPWIRPD